MTRFSTGVTLGDDATGSNSSAGWRSRSKASRAGLSKRRVWAQNEFSGNRRRHHETTGPLKRQLLENPHDRLKASKLREMLELRNGPGSPAEAITAAKLRIGTSRKHAAQPCASSPSSHSAGQPGSRSQLPSASSSSSTSFRQSTVRLCALAKRKQREDNPIYSRHIVYRSLLLALAKADTLSISSFRRNCD